MGHLSRRGLVLDVAVVGICLVANGSAFFLFCRSSRLRMPSLLGQPGRFRNHSSGRGFCEPR